MVFFGLGLYLIGVTIYKRSRSLNHSNFASWLFVIFILLSFVINFAVSQSISYEAASPGTILVLGLIGSIPFYYLWFANGNKDNSNSSSNSSIDSIDNVDSNTTNQQTIKNKNDMKGFKKCDKGHFYKDNLSDCNYCPKTEGSGGTAVDPTATEIIDTVPVENDKTQVFGGENPSSDTAIPPSGASSGFDPERTIISGSANENDSAPAESVVAKRKLRGWLVTFDHETFGVDYKINEGKNTIGKNPSNDITIEDNQVTGLHGIILCRKDKFILTDEVSTNGTLLNGQDLVPREAYDLSDGDEIKIGNTTLLFKTAFKN